MADRGIKCRLAAGVEDFSKASGPIPENTKSPIGAGVLPPIVKQPGREAGNLSSI